MSDENLPAEREESANEKQRARMNALISAVEDRAPQLTTLLEESGIPFKRFVEVFRRAIIKGQAKPETNLLLADAGSVIQSCMDACTAGLLPDGKQAAIVIFNQNVAGRGQPKRYVKKAQFMAMYEGLLSIAYASENFKSIQAQVVYDVDEWDYELGVDPWIKHKPGRRPPRPEGAPPYEVIASYAVAKTVNGGVFIEIFEPEDIRKVMAVSRASTGPNKDWFEQQCRKGPLRRLWKFLPKTRAMDRVLEADEGNYDLTPTEDDVPVAKTKLQAGFGKQAAIAQQKTETVDIPMEEIQEGEFAEIRDEAPESEQPKAQSAEPAKEQPQVIEPSEADLAFTRALTAASSWLNIKQALRGLRKANADRPLEIAELGAAWDRFEELRAEGGERTDFVTDMLLFECWLVGAEPENDAIVGNWRIIQKDPSFLKAPEEERSALAARVNWASEGGS